MGRMWKFLASEEGPTTSEYAIMLVMILGVLFVAIELLGGNTAVWWRHNTDAILSATGSTGRTPDG